MVPGCAAAVPYNTAAAFVRFFKELREASVARGFKHFQISIDNPIYAGQPQLAVAYNLSGLAEHIDFFMPMGYDMNGVSAAAPLASSFAKPEAAAAQMGTIVRNIGGCFKQKEVTPGWARPLACDLFCLFLRPTFICRVTFSHLAPMESGFRTSACSTAS